MSLFYYLKAETDELSCIRLRFGSLSFNQPGSWHEFRRLRESVRCR